jgi:hypothetical protein
LTLFSAAPVGVLPDHSWSNRPTGTTTENSAAAAGAASLQTQLLFLLNRTPPEKSKTNLKNAKKSEPKIGKATLASKKFQLNRRPAATTSICRRPQQLIREPSAPRSAGPHVGSVEVCGNTEKAAPESTRNRCLVQLSTR